MLLKYRVQKQYIAVGSLPGRAAFVPQDQDPTVETALFFDFLTPTFNILLFQWCYVFMKIDIRILWTLLSFHSFIENHAPTGKRKEEYKIIRNNIFLATRKHKKLSIKYFRVISVHIQFKCSNLFLIMFVAVEVYVFLSVSLCVVWTLYCHLNCRICDLLN